MFHSFFNILLFFELFFFLHDDFIINVAAGKVVFSNKPYFDPLPEASMNITEVISYYNYNVENHQVATNDGFILSLQRIPCEQFVKSCNTKTRPAVILQHGLVDSAHTWVDNPPKSSLGFMLADAGFDVWLSNSRGNTYSKSHQKYKPTDKEFWDFSFDEMILYDLPTIIDYVLNQTGHLSIGYVGHSQGTEMAFSYFNSHPQINKKINSAAMLAPVAYLGHVESALKELAKFQDVIHAILNIFGPGEFAPSSKLSEWIATNICTKLILEPLCYNAVFFLAGFDISNLNQTRLPVYLAHTPAGTSVKNLIHYAQGVNSNKFQAFDYGKEGNLAHYGQETPWQYGLNNITVPLALFSGGNDTLADPIDVARMKNELQTVEFHKEIDYYNHLDFVWGENAYKEVYPDVIKFLQKHSVVIN